MSEPQSPATQQEVETEGASTVQTAPGKPPDEAAGSSVDDDGDGQTTAAAATPEEQEQNNIVQAMDAAETNVLRQRRTAFYSRHDTLIGKCGSWNFQKINRKSEMMRNITTLYNLGYFLILKKSL